MDTSELPVITISREYGAGGRTVAKALSEKLGIPWYDKDFVKETAQDSGYSEEDIQREGEELSQFTKIMEMIMNGSVVYNSFQDKIFLAQKEEVLKLAKSPCIIVGRCANAILKEAGVKTFSVFLFADIDYRAIRAAELSDGKISDIKKFIEKRDALRRNYYKNYTKKDLGNYKDYNLFLDTGVISKESCVEIIEKAVRG